MSKSFNNHTENSKNTNTSEPLLTINITQDNNEIKQSNDINTSSVDLFSHYVKFPQ